MLSKPRISTISSTRVYSLIPNNIPEELDGLADSMSATWGNGYSTELPNVEVVALNGASELGTLLWAYVLYSGIFTTSGRPAEWILPPIATILRKDQDLWFQDFKQGYLFDLPPLIEFLRVAIFLFLGFFCNRTWIAILDGDTFWGWSTALAIAIPTGLLNLSRDKLLSRSDSIFQNNLISDFKAFIMKRVVRKKGVITSEEAILRAFKLSSPEYRTLEKVSDKLLKRLLRAFISFKPTTSSKTGEMIYNNIELLNIDVEVKLALQKAVKDTQREREEMLQFQERSQTESSDVIENEDWFGNEFIRRKTLRK